MNEELFLEFLKILRRALLMIVRWIERAGSAVTT